MRVDPKALVRRLTPSSTRMLEAAVGKAASAQHREVTPEHLLLTILEPEGADAAPVLRHFGVDVGRLLAEVERACSRMPAGSGKPTFSPALFRWIEDAWLLASVELGDIRLRSGALLAQLAATPERYLADTFNGLEGIRADELRRDFGAITVDSPEASQAAPDWDQAPRAEGGGSGSPADQGALGRFTTNFTQLAADGRIDPVFGRHREIRQVIDILTRRRKNNPLVVGEPGVGKTALVEGLARSIVAGEVPEQLRNVQLVGLDLGLLQAGASVKGEFENRLKSIISEVKASPVPIILFIDEAHTLIGAGGSQGGDAANLLKPALARGELRTIAATTWAEFKKYFEKDAALERRFQPVKVGEPSEADTVGMLRGLKSIYEEAHGVRIRDEAVVAAAELSHRYISGRQLPDKAVDLLDTAAARVRVERAAKPELIEELEMRVASFERERDGLTRDTEEGVLSTATERLEELDAELESARGQLDELHARWNAQREAVERVLEARLVQPEGDEEAATAARRDAVREATQALESIADEQALVHADVDADAVARTVAAWTGIPVGNMKRSTAGAVLELEDTLGARVVGQDTAVRAVAETLRVSHAGIRDPNTPIGVMLFVGPSGVGKTETALALADALYGGERFLTSINMSEFQEKHTVSRLIGSPPGYVGYGEGGVLTEAVRQRPYSVVLLDECEKADLEVMNLFYQVFDKGMLSDGEGRQIDFRNTLIILTSNLASDRVMRCFEEDEAPAVEDVIQAIRPTLSEHFQPALLARMTIVPYGPIAPETMRSIARLKLDKLAARVQSAHGLQTEFSPTLIDEIAQRCTEAETGARNVDHILRGSLMPAIAGALLEEMAGEPSTGGVLHVDVAPSGQWRVELA